MGTLPPVLVYNGGPMIGEIPAIIEPVHLVVRCCAVVRVCSTQHQGAYTGPALYLLLVIVCEEKK